MSYDFKITGAVHVKEGKEYPWPTEKDPNRTIEIFDDDVLTKEENGKYMKHTGLCCFNIVIPDEDTVAFDGDCNLTMM